MKKMMTNTTALQWCCCVLGLLMLNQGPHAMVEADTRRLMSKKSKSDSKMSMKSKSKMSMKSKSEKNVFAPHSPTPAAPAPPSDYYYYSMMGKGSSSMKSMMSKSSGKGYEGSAGGEEYEGSKGKSMMGKSSSKTGKSSKGKGKGSDDGKSSMGKGSSMSGKGKGDMSIRMMGGKGKGKGKGKGATYQTPGPTMATTSAPVAPTPPPSILLETRAPAAPMAQPTASPTRQNIPSREELCEPDEEGVYGTQEGTTELVEFAYALETVTGTTDAEVEQIIDDLEGEIAASVIARLVPECTDDTARRELGQQQGPQGHRRLAQVLTGLSPKPDDERLLDRECDKDVGDNRCDLVRASLTIWYIETDDRRRRRLQDDVIAEIEGAIQGGMNDGEFDGLGRDADPNDPSSNIVSVEWVPIDSLEDDGTRDVGPVAPKSDDDDGLDLLWIIVIAAGGAALCFLLAAAFLCTRRASVDNEEEQHDLKVDGAEGDEQSESRDPRLGSFQYTGPAGSDSGRASL